MLQIRVKPGSGIGRQFQEENIRRGAVRSNQAAEHHGKGHCHQPMPARVL